MRTRCDFTVASVTESVAAISRFERPCARQASTSRSRELSSSLGCSSSGRGRTEPASAPCKPGDDVLLALERGADHRGEVFGAAGPERDTARAERDEIADDALLAGCEHRDDGRRRPQPREPAHGVGDREVGGLTDHDEIGSFHRGDARDLAPGMRLRDDVDTLRVQHRSDAEAREGQLVGHDCALFIGVVVHVGCASPECCDQASYRRIYRQRAMLTQRGHVFQPRGLSSAQALRGRNVWPAETSRAGPGEIRDYQADRLEAASTKRTRRRKP